ncbi:U3_assoc_6-domain-containing protein [Fragilariopsis cylindrus CCMP1102]|uniref:U3_assoc_6-domain-containing protein n=1 Tax=Fragilariopsis cylindrus CCMP1102 TaxID=635003 RepID=A0A1E7FPU2_9STRA|nr:U3_assoc_6-domain-containing protein [Fragilariopsis cylindrus CCMP1102]|eukprot:OEU20178.1 U3_assoc_6-domain-containing protein [Fragilariopsis cylindrus CCMP1102]
MAEHVQASLDAMVAPLHDLLERNIFSETEIRAIVTRRRESEYLLRRRAARKADFIRYLDSEMILEKLRAIRTTKKKRDHRKSLKDGSITDKNDDNNDNNDKDKDKQQQEQKDHIGDIHIIQHIHLLFVRVIRKFRGDISLHIRHATFCKDVKSFTRLGRVYAEALQLFPRESGLWIEAASNEFFGLNRNIKNARVLLQRSIRINGNNSEQLWLQYFTLELHYSQTLKGRQRILYPEDQDNKDQEEHDSDIDGDKESDDDHVEGDTHDYYKIPLVILRNAIVAIPKSIDFRLQFLDICTKFPDTNSLMNYIQNSMNVDFGTTEPKSWIARAIYEVDKQKQDNNNNYEPKSKKARTSDGNKKVDPVVKVLQEAINAIPTNEAVKIIKAYCTKSRRNGSGSGNGTGNAPPCDAWILWTSLVTPLRKQKTILERAVRTISMDTHPDYVTVLLQLFGAQMKIMMMTENDDNHDDEEELLLKNEKSLFDTLQKIILLAPKTVNDVRVEGTGLEFELTDVFTAYLACLNFFFFRSSRKNNRSSSTNGGRGDGGIQGARSVYESVLFRSTVTLSNDNVEKVKIFIDRCIKLEQQELLDTTTSIAGKKKKRQHLCGLYDKAVEIFKGTSLEDSYREDRNEQGIFGGTMSS